MINRNSRISAKRNGYHGRKNSKGKKKSSKVTIYEETNRSMTTPARHMRSFRGLDHLRKPR